MAVKVMLAPSIAQRDPKSRESSPRSGDTGRKPKRRGSAVYDAEGNEVFITLLCLKCHKMRPLSKFGLRRMADGSIRNQPWCHSCRSSTPAEGPQRRRRTAVPAEERVNGGEGAAKILDASSLAAQVVAALHGGRR